MDKKKKNKKPKSKLDFFEDIRKLREKFSKLNPNFDSLKALREVRDEN